MSLQVFSGKIILGKGADAIVLDGSKKKFDVMQGDKTLASFKQALPTLGEYDFPAGGVYATIIANQGSTYARSTISAFGSPQKYLDVLASLDSVTVFVPTNAAFAALPDGVVSALLANAPKFQNILKYHHIAGTITSKDLQELGRVEEEIGLEEEGNVDRLDDDGNVDGNVEDNAFKVQLFDLLSGDAIEYPTVNGQSVNVEVNGNIIRVGGKTVVVADKVAGNVTMHFIDGVLIPPDDGSIEEPNPDPTPAPTPDPTLIQLATTTPTLSKLVELVSGAGLVDAIVGATAMTILAPSNAAFEKIASVLPTLTPAQVTKVLLSHIIDAKVLSTALSNGMKAMTLSGVELTVKIANGKVSFQAPASTGMVTIADVTASNGVVHIIDTVLLPDLSATPAPTPTPAPAPTPTPTPAPAPTPTPAPAPTPTPAPAPTPETYLYLVKKASSVDVVFNPTYLTERASEDLKNAEIYLSGSDLSDDSWVVSPVLLESNGYDFSNRNTAGGVSSIFIINQNRSSDVLYSFAGNNTPIVIASVNTANPGSVEFGTGPTGNSTLLASGNNKELK